MGFIELQDIIASDCCKRFFIASRWSRVRVFAVEISIEIRADDVLSLILIRSDFINALLEHLCDLILRKSRIERDVGNQLKTFAGVFFEKLSKPCGVIECRIRAKRSADKIEFSRDLIRSARLRSFPEQTRSQRSQPFPSRRNRPQSLLS